MFVWCNMREQSSLTFILFDVWILILNLVVVTVIRVPEFIFYSFALSIWIVESYNHVTKYIFEQLVFVGWVGKFVVENLPNLKSLILNTVDTRFFLKEKAIKMIAEKCARLKYLEVELKEMKAENAVAVLKEKLPGFRGFVIIRRNLMKLWILLICKFMPSES